MKDSLFSRAAAVAAVILGVTVVSFGQMRTGGQVVEIVDGRTATVLTRTGRVTVELQYVDVPESEQPLHSLVKHHLQTLLLGKTVEVYAMGFSPERTHGQIFVNGVDVGRQLLRDGAAWHVPIDTTSQKKDEFDAYAESEALARQEKRGVWSIANLQPAWEFREARLAQIAAERAPAVTEEKQPDSVRLRPRGYWSDKNPSIGDVGALAHGYNAETRMGYVSTTLLRIIELEASQAADHTTAMDITYWYKEDDLKGRSGVFVVTVVSDSSTARFLTNNDLVLQGEKSTTIGKAKRTVSNAPDRVREKLTYEVHRSAIETLVHSTVTLKINNYTIQPTGFAYSVLHHMLQASAPRQIATNEKPSK